eukprot:TRINITY_DN33417_c0_g1_i1.p1 TRINITY_DN33417_c0_g1~~TRINITY_DN33417_c0_g1_i1.p1  ORF type:complete len:193 (+),score=52.56 TRINITY_DN33417_c0_g1_i1:53-631(+)
MPAPVQPAYRVTPEELHALLGELVDAAADEGTKWEASHRNVKVPVTYYDGEVEATISTADYLKRWTKYLKYSKAAFVVASIYLSRFVELRKVHITHRNKLRVLLCCLVAADKFLNDKSWTNKAYAWAGGVPLTELNYLERIFLTDIQFELYVTNSLYTAYCDETIACLRRRAAARAATRRRAAQRVHAGIMI